jgi:hypothetical protein
LALDNEQIPINARTQRQLPLAVEDFLLAVREHLIWPIEDRALTFGVPGRVLALSLVAVLAVGVGGFALVSSGGSGEPASTEVATRVAPPATQAPAPASKPEPTLHGAAPVFKPKATDPALAGDQGAKGSGASSEATGSAAADKISSSPAPGSNHPPTPAANGPLAPPAALHTAQMFARVFVYYETGYSEKLLRYGFSRTATPELTKSLMRRPPRQPANVKVPRAKVLNVVPAPSHAGIYPVSVSLLRVGVTSELRLELERLKSKGWRVANVLG